MHGNTRRNASVISILLAQIMAAASSYAPSSTFSDMAKNLGLNVTGLGALTTAYFLGIGPMQLFAGILTARIGGKRTIVSGLVLGSVSMVMSSVSSQFGIIVFLRFLTGVGMALVFAPGVTMITGFSRKGSAGFVIGLFMSAYYLGGIALIPGLAVLGKIAGWRLSFLFVGVYGFFAATVLTTLVPGRPVENRFQIRISDLPKVVLNKSLIVMGTACLSLQVGWATVGSFIVFYLEDKFTLAPATAGEFGSLFLVAALLSSTLAERIRARAGSITTVLASGVLSVLGLALIAFVPVFGVAIATFLVGTASGMGFTTAYVLVTQSIQSEERYVPLSVSWVNSMSLFGGFWTPILFSNIAANYGYLVAWLVTGAVSIPLMLPLLVMKIPEMRRNTSPPPPESQG